MKANGEFSPYGDKLDTFKKLLHDYICKNINGATDLPYMNGEPMYTTMLEILACSLDQIKMSDLPISLPSDSIAQDLARFRLNYIRRNARKELDAESQKTGRERTAAYPEGFSQEVKRVGADEMSDRHTENVPDPVIQKYEEMIAQLKEQLSDKNDQCGKLEKERNYWKDAFCDVSRQEAAKNQLLVSKKYKLDKLSKVEFLNNLIATEPYSSAQLNFIQHCLLQDIPIKLISKCTSAALPVSFMEDYIRYSCSQSGIRYIEYGLH